MSQPVIGVTLDAEEPGGYSKLPWYALRQNYCEAVIRAGGLPILLPHEPEQAAAYLDRIDGLVVTGGAFDVEDTTGPLARNTLVLGVRDGQEVLRVVRGDPLVQHIHGVGDDALPDE